MVRAIIVALTCCPSTAGVPPRLPTATWLFWARMAAATSLGVIWKLFSLLGSSQMRMAYWLPKIWIEPTPGVRLKGSRKEVTM